MTYFHSTTFTIPAGESEVAVEANEAYITDDDRVNPVGDTIGGVLLPWTYTWQIYGDGLYLQRNRIWEAGDPSTATIYIYDEDVTNAPIISLNAAFPSEVVEGQTVNLEFEVSNQGSVSTGDTVSVTSDRDDVACTINGPIAPGELRTCTASFIARQSPGSSIEFKTVASDGTYYSKAFYDLHK